VQKIGQTPVTVFLEIKIPAVFNHITILDVNIDGDEDDTDGRLLQCSVYEADEHVSV